MLRSQGEFQLLLLKLLTAGASTEDMLCEQMAASC